MQVQLATFPLLLGATAPSLGLTIVTGSGIDVKRLQNFTVVGFASGSPTSGSLVLQGQIESSLPWINIATGAFNSATGQVFQFNGPWSQVRAIYNTTTGTFNAYIMGQNA